MQLIRYYYDIFYFNRTTFDFPKDLLFLIPLMIFPLLDSIKNYIIKYFLQYYYYSIYFMYFLIGTLDTALSTLLYFIFF